MPFAARVLYNFIDKLWVNHRPTEEGILLKLSLLTSHSAIIALAAVGISILYSAVITNIFDIEKLSPSVLSGIALLFVMLNSIYRFATYAHISRGDECDFDEDEIQTKKSVFQRSYFSFLFTLLIFGYLGIGVTIFTDPLTPQYIVEVDSYTIAIQKVVQVVLATSIISTVTEAALWIGPFTIPPSLIDDLQ